MDEPGLVNSLMTQMISENCGSGQTSKESSSEQVTVFQFASGNSKNCDVTGNGCELEKCASGDDGRAVSPNDEEEFMRNKTEDKNKKSQNPPVAYSTTSSVYAEHTISNPDNDQVNYCIAAILQAQIFDDSNNPDLIVGGDYSHFEIFIKLPAEYGGEVERIPENILRHETLNDLELREKLMNGVVPTVDTIYRFISMLIGLATFSVECNILALIYINRMTGRNRIAMTMKNWRGLWVSAIILAQKVWDDTPLKTSSFAKILPNVRKDQLKELEMSAFTLLEFSTTVRPSVYAKYYFELRQLFCEIAGNSKRYRWNMEPLSIAEGKRLEHRSQLQGHSRSKDKRENKTSRQNSDNDNTTASSVSNSVSTVDRGITSKEKLAATFNQNKLGLGKTYEDATFSNGKSYYVIKGT